MYSFYQQTSEENILIYLLELQKQNLGKWIIMLFGIITKLLQIICNFNEVTSFEFLTWVIC